MSEEEILKECTELAENEHHELGDCWDEEYSSSAIFGLIMLYKQTKESEEVLANKLQEVNIELEKYKRLAEMNLKDSEEFQNNMCEHRCILNNQIMELTEELNNLKEIEKSHQEENGLLRQELDMQIEHNKELDATLKQTQDSWFEDTQKIEQLKLNGKVKNTGKLVKNKIDGTIGIVLREWETGQIQVLEKIQPKVINTHDSWKTLEVIEDE